MKNLKYVYKFMLVLPLFFMVGCVETDDYDDVESGLEFTQQSTVFIETDDASEITRTVPGNVAQPVSVGVNNSSTSEITVSFRVVRDGVEAEDGVDYTLPDATIPSSEFYGDSEVTFLKQGFYEVYVRSSSSGSVVDNRLLFNVPPAVTVSISWADPFYDYDLYLIEGNQDIGGNVLANTFDTIAFETFDIYPPEGFSSVYIDDWWDDNAGTDVIMTVEIDGVIDVYPVVMDADKFVLVFETTFDEDGNPNYDITAL